MPGPRCHFMAMLPRCRCHVGAFRSSRTSFSTIPAIKEVKETCNKSGPSDDIALLSGYIADFTQKMATYAGSAVNPEEYGKQMVSRLCPITLPYELEPQLHLISRDSMGGHWAIMLWM